MPYTTLIDTPTLESLLGDPAVAIVDCRFRLDDPSWGEDQYAAAHVPGAAYAHLDRDLSSTPTGRNGRHPLPSPEVLAATLGRLGIGSGTQVVAYDQDNGAWASRLWWLLRWMGHDLAAVLDGGFAAWQREARPTRPGLERAPARTFTPRLRPERLAGLGFVEQVVAGTARATLVDARAPERYRGEIEPIDRVGGHVPGALNHAFRLNVDEAGRFLPREVLRSQFERNLAGADPAAPLVVYCGSGVTACQNLLALEHAGIAGARLYPGSWSEWSSAPERPVATGDRP
ncbi:MAG: sulfurtransferase [Vicinamibacterales bacterium]